MRDGEYFSLNLRVNASQVIPIEAKLGAIEYDVLSPPTVINQEGIFNPWDGPGRCELPGPAPGFCTDSSAVAGMVIY